MCTDTLNVGGVSEYSNYKALIVRLCKKEQTIWSLQRKKFKYKDTDTLKVKGWKNIYPNNANHKKVIVAALI